MSSGFKTTEFYLVFGNIIAGLLVMTGVLLPERSSEIGELIAQAIGGIVSLGALVFYIISRTELKKKQIEGVKQG